jgi:hypothetical protein
MIVVVASDRCGVAALAKNMTFHQQYDNHVQCVRAQWQPAGRRTGIFEMYQLTTVSHGNVVSVPAPSFK